MINREVLMTRIVSLTSLMALFSRVGIMQSRRLMGVAVIAATCMCFHPYAHAYSLWSTSAVGCVPVSASGLVVTAGAVTATVGNTVTLYCGGPTSIGRPVTHIEISYKGGGTPEPTEARDTQAAARLDQFFRGIATAEFIEVSKETGAETSKCAVQSNGSFQIATDAGKCSETGSIPNIDKNFYYVRIMVKSGLFAGQDMSVYAYRLVGSRRFLPERPPRSHGPLPPARL